MPLDHVLEGAVKSCAEAEDGEVMTILLSVAAGIDAVVTRCKWDTEAICTTVAVLGRMPPESHTSRLVLGAFFGHQLWRDRYSDMSRRLQDFLGRRSPEQQRILCLAWVRLALLAVDEQVRMRSRYTRRRHHPREAGAPTSRLHAPTHLCSLLTTAHVIRRDARRWRTSTR